MDNRLRTGKPPRRATNYPTQLSPAKYTSIFAPAIPPWIDAMNTSENSEQTKQSHRETRYPWSRSVRWCWANETEIRAARWTNVARQGL